MSDEPWWIGEKREEGSPKSESPEVRKMKGEGGCQLSVGGCQLEEREDEVAVAVETVEKVAETVRRGGVIDFGTSKKGTCQVPLMMGNSREYGGW